RSLRDWSSDVCSSDLSWDGKRVAYAVHPNNSDEATLRVFDVDAMAELPDAIPGADYASPSWTPDGAGFYYTRMPADPAMPRSERSEERRAGKESSSGP